MKYLIKRLFEYIKYRNDMYNLFEILLANAQKVDITPHKLEMETDKGNQIAKWVIELIQQENK